MLQSLDTLIAFVVIMIIVSLFVTILVQMASAALSLRGKNLANALALTFQSIDPTLSASAHQLAARILSDPLLSDSALITKDRGTPNGPRRTGPWRFLSLSWQPFCDLRNATKLANAIRPEEVYGALKKLAAGDESKSKATRDAENELTAAHNALSSLNATGDKTAALKAVSDAEAKLASSKNADSSKFAADLAAKQDNVRAAELNVANSAAEARKAALQKLKTAQKELDTFCSTSLSGTAWKLLAALGAPADKATAVADKLSAFSQLASAITDPAIKAQFDKALQDTSANLVHLIDTERGKLDRFFNSAQDRAQQWFQLHTRVVTICASASIAILFQLDAVEIFHYVSTNSAARAALVTGAQKVIKEGDGILDDEKGGLIKRINDAWNGTPTRLTPEELAGILHTGQLQERISAKDPQKFDTMDFNQVVESATKAYYKDQSDKISELTRGVSATGFELIPVGFWRWKAEVPAHPEFWPVCYYIARSYLRHGLGILLFAGLLTLGAPYWYNLLKNLTSLRPALAQLIGKEDAAQTPTKN